MGLLLFGPNDTIECIVDVELRGPGGEELCLAYRETTYWAGAGVWMKTDYVLRPKNDTKHYYELSAEAREGNVIGIPHPLPPYSVPLFDRVFAFSLWWIIGGLVLWAVAVKLWRKRQQRALLERRASSPIDRGPPRLDTEGDRAIHAMVAPALAAGESIQHQAYVTEWDYANDKAGDGVCFLVLTTQRLVTIVSRKGAFSILYENEKTIASSRAEITGARIAHGNVFFVSVGGIERGYVVARTRALSNQDAFLLNADRILAAPS